MPLNVYLNVYTCIFLNTYKHTRIYDLRSLHPIPGIFEEASIHGGRFSNWIWDAPGEKDLND